MTTEEREVMELALATLESYEKSAYIKQSHPKRWANGNKAITTIKAALEAHKALMSVSDGAQSSVSEHLEPVAWTDGPHLVMRTDWRDRANYKGPWVDIGRAIPDSWVPVLYTTPPQRTWVGLTIGEIQDLIQFKEHSPFALAEDIEAKLKEKNT